MTLILRSRREPYLDVEFLPGFHTLFPSEIEELGTNEEVPEVPEAGEEIELLPSPTMGWSDGTVRQERWQHSRRICTSHDWKYHTLWICDALLCSPPRYIESYSRELGCQVQIARTVPT